MRILCNILVVLFVTATAVGQQINPVPDYIFRNSMSVGRNAPTDTSAYFSIGPRFGATRGFMPPMVVDTAAVTGTKRNGLLIYSIQRNSFLYWDSTGSRWSRIAANLDTLLLSTRAWRQKGDDSLAAIINTRTDTVLISTRAWRQKGIDSVASVRIGGSGTTNAVPRFTASRTLGNSTISDDGSRAYIETSGTGGGLEIRRFGTPMGILATPSSTQFSLSALGSNNLIFVTNAGTLLQLGAAGGVSIDGTETWIGGTDNGAYKFQVNGNVYNTTGPNVFNASSGESLFGTTTDAGDFRVQVSGNQYVSGNVGIGMTPSNKLDVSGVIGVNTSGQTRTISSFYGSGADGFNIWIGGGGTSSGTGGGASSNGSYNTAVGHESMLNNTTGSFNVAFGRNALRSNTTGVNNAAVGINAMFSSTTANENTAVGNNALLNSVLARNTAVGNSAGSYRNNGDNLSTVSNSVFIGYDTRALNTTSENEIVIGYQGRGNGSNTTTIGNALTTATYLPSGQLYTNGSIYNTTDVTASGTPSLSILRTGVSSTDALFTIGNGTNTASQFLPTFVTVSNFSSGGSTIGGLFSAFITNSSADDLGLLFSARTKSASAMTQGWITSFRNFTTDHVRIAHDGNMVLQNGGTFTNAGYKLDVQGTMRNTGNAFLAETSGNVGIGTVSASEKLHVVGRARVTTIDSSASPINMLWADVNGVVRKAPVPTASVSGGTTNFIPLWSSSTALTSSIIEQRSSELLVNTNRDTGAYVLQVQGASWFGGAIKTMTDIDIGGNNVISSSGRTVMNMGTSGTTRWYSSGSGTSIQFYPNNVLGMQMADDNELKIAQPSTTADSGNYKLQVFGNTFTDGSITTAAPSGGSKKPWKLGAKIAGAVSLDQGNYLEVEVDGVFYRIALVTPD